MGTAAAEIGIQFADDIRGRRMGIFVQERASGEDHPRRAIATLERVMVDERLLDRMKFVFLCQSLDRNDRFAVDFTDGGAARPDRFLIGKDGARSAQSDTATVLRAGQREIGAQHPQEQPILLDGARDRFVVELETDGIHLGGLRDHGGWNDVGVAPVFSKRGCGKVRFSEMFRNCFA